MNQAQNAYANSTGQLLAATTRAQIAQPVLEQHADRLSTHGANVSGFAERLHALADRIMGSVPTDPVNTAPQPPASHSLGRLEDAHEWLNRAIERLDAAVKRLETL